MPNPLVVIKASGLDPSEDKTLQSVIRIILKRNNNNKTKNKQRKTKQKKTPNKQKPTKEATPSKTQENTPKATKIETFY